MKGRIGSIYNQRSSVHTVVLLGDGRVHVLFAQPIAQSKSQLWLLVMLGNRRGNEIITSAGKIVGVIVCVIATLTWILRFVLELPK